MVGRKYADVATRIVKYQGFDPGTELLLSQTGAEALLAKVPKGIHRDGCRAINGMGFECGYYSPSGRLSTGATDFSDLIKQEDSLDNVPVKQV